MLDVKAVGAGIHIHAHSVLTETGIMQALPGVTLLSWKALRCTLSPSDWTTLSSAVLILIGKPFSLATLTRALSAPSFLERRSPLYQNHPHATQTTAF